MVEEHPSIGRNDFVGEPNALPHSPTIDIEPRWRRFGKTEKVREQVTGQKQSFRFGIETAMPRSVARQSHDPETSPERQLVPRFEPVIDFRSLIARQTAPHRLDPAANSAQPPVGIASFDVSGIDSRSEYRSVGFTPEAGDVPRVIQVTMRENDGFHIPPSQFMELQFPTNPSNCISQKTAIDENDRAFLVIDQRIAGHDQAGHRDGFSG